MSSMIIRRLGVLFGVEMDKNSEKDAKDSIEGIKGFAKKALGALAIGVSLVRTNAIAQEFSAVNTMIKNGTQGLGDQNDIQNKILEAANLTKTAYSDTAKMVTNLVQENSELFESLDEAISFNNAATMLFKTAGKTDEQIAGLMEAINKSFAKGAVDSETINQLLEQSPEAVKLLNERLGTTSAELLQMATDGKMTLSDLKEAFTSNAEAIAEKYAETGVNITEAIGNIRNQWGLYVSQLWSGAGVSTRIGKIMTRSFSEFMRFLRKAQPDITNALKTALSWIEKVADMISRVGSFLGRLIDKAGGAVNAIKILALVVGSIWLAFNAGKIIDFLTKLPGMMKAAFSVKNLKLLSIAALITVVILVIDDFVNFLKGNKSVIGECLESWGIDAEAVRQKIVTALQKVKDFLLGAVGLIRSIVSRIRRVITEFMQSDEGHATFQRLWQSVGNVVKAAGKTIQSIVRAISAVVKVVFDTLQAFWGQYGSTIMSMVSIAAEGIMTILNGLLLMISGVCDLVAALINGDWAAAWQAAQDILNAAWQTIVGFIQAALAGIYAIVTGILGLILSFFQTIFQNISKTVSDKIKAVSQTITTGLDAAISFLKDLPSQALQWGSDFIGGFIDGIKGKIGELKDTAKEIASSVTSFLHFSRPDEGPLRDYETWMPDMVQGLSRTLKASRPKLAATVKDVAYALNINPRIQTALNAVGINKAGNVVHQNVEINNTVKTSDREAGRKASERLEKSGDDVTKEIKKALVYGRA